MNIWIVGCVFVVYFVVFVKMNFDGIIVEKGCKMFFFKGRIMVG